MSALLLAAALWVGPAMSGSWYAPERSGEGFTLQVLEDGSALVLWFTYPPEGSAATQAWIYADGGVVDGDRIRFERAYTTRGPRFGAAYDPRDLRLEPWGTLEFHFTSCNAAEVTYAGPPAWGSGARHLARLTALAELECGGKRRVGAGGARTLEGLRQRGGAWFDPSHDGEGWTFEPLPDGHTLIYWFTYDANGNQAWTVGVASESGTRLVAESTLRPTGARFGTAFDPAQVHGAPWGTLEIEFASCNAATARYAASDAAFGSGTLHATRLSRLAGSVCLDEAPAVPLNGTWSQGPPLPLRVSEVGTATTGAFAYVAGGIPDATALLRLDLARLAWERLAPLPAGRNHAIAVAAGDEILVSAGYPTGAAVSGARYSIARDAWEPADSLPRVVASGGAMLGGFAWFGDMSGDLWQYDPRSRASRRFAWDGRAPRDHSQVAAFQGELWMIAGREELQTEAATVSIFDPASETWRPGPTLRVARGGFAVAASPTLLMVAGGEVLGDGRRVLSSVEGIAAGDQAWSAMPPLRTSVHGVGGALFGNAFFAIGGSTTAGQAVNPGLLQIYRW